MTPSLQFACYVGDSVKASWWSCISTTFSASVCTGPSFPISGAETLAEAKRSLTDLAVLSAAKLTLHEIQQYNRTKRKVGYNFKLT